MTSSELKYNVDKTGSYFFLRSSMKFFRDTIKNYGVKKTIINDIEVWELWRKKPVKSNLADSAYFDYKTFERIFPKR